MTVFLDLQIVTSMETPSATQFQRWVEAALQEVEQDCELSIRLVDTEEVADLNRRYRGKSGSTNVLSFPFDAPFELSPRLLGDLVICGQVVEQEAIEQNKAVNDHWAHIVVHGCLHLLGYDHIEDGQAEQMEALEIQILQTLNIINPYSQQGEQYA